MCIGGGPAASDSDGVADSFAKYQLNGGLWEGERISLGGRWKGDAA